MAILGEPINAGVTSWGTGSDFVAKLLAGQCFNGLVWNGTGSTFDASCFGQTPNFTKEGTSLRDVKFTLEAHLATPQDGLLGLVTFGNGDALNLNGWDMNITRPLYDVTVFGSYWRQYKPGLVSWSGSYSGFIDDTTAVNGPLLTGLATNGFGDATFTILSGGATGKALNGNINYTGTSGDIKRGKEATKSYNFKGSGALKTVGTVAGTDVLWTADATGALLSEVTSKTLVLTYNTAMTLSGTAFWSSIRINNKVGQPVKITVDGSFSDVVTGLDIVG
jgi:hypothetical protein